jgi:hypothetical protein
MDFLVDNYSLTDILKEMPDAHSEIQKLSKYGDIKWIFYTEQVNEQFPEKYKIFVSSKGDILFRDQFIDESTSTDFDDDFCEVYPRRFDYPGVELSIKDDIDLCKKTISLENIHLIVKMIDKRIYDKFQRIRRVHINFL